MERQSLGKAGETAAAEFLKASGYQIMARNYRAQPGEIDIIAVKSGTIVFVEVKTRSSLLCGTPAEAVTARKQRKIISTALCFLKHHGHMDAPCRFDIVEVLVKGAGQPRCNHIINAFGG